GAQIILKHYFEGSAADDTRHLYALRTAGIPIAIHHPNVGAHISASRFSLAPLLELRTLIRRWRIDVVHCHLFRSQVFGYLLKTLFFPQITLMFHEHGRVVGREMESRFEALLYRIFLRSAWRRVDRFVCISEHTRARLLQVIPGAARRSTVVANPISAHPDDALHEEAGALRRDFAIPPDVFVVGFAARLVERKGWRDFLEAVRILSARIPVFFLLAGDGEDHAKVEAYIRDLGLDRCGRMLGHVTRMERFYRTLDCFVMPPHWEPHGLSHLEAQSHGIPVVVSNAPGLNDTVHPDADALLFDVGDVSALADAMYRVASDPKLRNRLTDGGLINATRYTLETFSSALDQIYADNPACAVDAVGARQI
ncbi:MAG: glycosyltransferase, partial [Thermoanaerobaculia bacterium]